jgi:hypothetical protein
MLSARNTGYAPPGSPFRILCVRHSVLNRTGSMYAEQDEEISGSGAAGGTEEID